MRVPRSDVDRAPGRVSAATSSAGGEPGSGRVRYRAASPPKSRIGLLIERDSAAWARLLHCEEALVLVHVERDLRFAGASTLIVQPFAGDTAVPTGAGLSFVAPGPLSGAGAPGAFVG
jgi:hypothetical protein